MTNIEKKSIEKAHEIINRFLQKGAVVNKADYEFVLQKFSELQAELIFELKNN